MFLETLLVYFFGLLMNLHIRIYFYFHFLHLLLYPFQLFDSGDSCGLFGPLGTPGPSGGERPSSRSAGRSGDRMFDGF